jgi:hypothetical protein
MHNNISRGAYGYLQKVKKNPICLQICPLLYFCYMFDESVHIKVHI